MLRKKLRKLIKDYDLDLDLETRIFDFVDWLNEYFFVILEIIEPVAFYFYDVWNIMSIAELIYLFKNRTFRNFVWRFSGIYPRRNSKEWRCEYRVDYKKERYVVNLCDLWENIKLILRYVKVIFSILFWVIYAVICLWLKFLSILIPKLFVCLVVAIFVWKMFPYVYKFINIIVDYVYKFINIIIDFFKG